MIVIPAIDLRGGRTVRLVEGMADRETRYDLDPVDVAIRFESAGAEMLHLVDLDGAFDGSAGSANAEIVRAILSAVRIPVEVGGGLRNEDAVSRALDCGAQFAILGTAAVENPKLVEKLAARYPGRIVAGIDARDGRVATRGWTDVTEVDAVELGKRMREAGVSRAIYTDIARDGKLQGPNLGGTVRFAEGAGLDVTVSGGVSSIDDIASIAASSCSRIHSCIVGKAIYEGRVAVADAVRAARRDCGQGAPELLP